MTLRDVQRASEGAFTASGVGGYERGERMISLERFCRLAAVYGVPADQLLSEILTEQRPQLRQEVVIDLTRLPLLGKEDERVVGEFVQRVRLLRSDYRSEVLTLRRGDLEILAHASHRSPTELLDRLAPALRATAEAPSHAS
jgi:transcriptional regulator with XRE-family HTH domain